MLQNKGNTAERLLKWHLFLAATVDGIGTDIVWRLWFIGRNLEIFLECSGRVLSARVVKYEKLFS